MCEGECAETGGETLEETREEKKGKEGDTDK